MVSAEMDPRIEGVPYYMRHIIRNLDAELAAFSARLGEKFEQNQLIAALIDKSHLEHERKNGTLISTDAKSNEDLAGHGQMLVEKYSTEFVEESWSHIPEEAVRSIVSFLCCDESMSEVAQSIGLKDLVFAEPYPPSAAVMARAARAVVATLSSTRPDSVPVFVENFVTTRLVGQRLWDMWQVPDPLSVLQQILSRSDDSAEARLVKSAGCKTLEAVYQVALYNKNKTFLSTGFGESIDVAVAEAAREALDKLFGDTSSRPPLKFTRSLPPSCCNLPAHTASPDAAHPPLSEWSLARADPRHGNIIVC
ncbi:Ribonuclease III domain [Trinorchestia longiramus]|nr:Ribonuclease III domain [Trinorchestia longiramus]